MRKILQQITGVIVVLEIQIPYFLRPLQEIYQKNLIRNISKSCLALHPTQDISWGLRPVRSPEVLGSLGKVVGLLFTFVIIILFVIFRVVSILTIFNFLFLNSEERLQVSNPGHFGFSYTWRYSLFA